MHDSERAHWSNQSYSPGDEGSGASYARSAAAPCAGNTWRPRATACSRCLILDCGTYDYVEAVKIHYSWAYASSRNAAPWSRIRAHLSAGTPTRKSGNESARLRKKGNGKRHHPWPQKKAAPPIYSGLGTQRRIAEVTHREIETRKEGRNEEKEGEGVYADPPTHTTKPVSDRECFGHRGTREVYVPHARRSDSTMPRGAGRTARLQAERRW
ncbi:hypothetical protein B0H13DRAFT_2264481 [Mycena leptocephala]|nr:hypothetical protein B0H13DRAFT_2264481 [Mycena leptocephala]